MTLVRDIMSRGVVTVPASTGMRDVARTMTRYDITGVAITDEEEGTIGVVTHTDLVKHFGEKDLTAEDIMTEIPDTIRPDATLIEAADKMTRNEVHRLFVMPRGEIFECNSCIGMITSTDLVDAMSKK